MRYINRKRLCKSCTKILPLTEEFFYRTGLSRVFKQSCKSCTNESNRRSGKKFRSQIRDLVLQVYGGNNPVCSCCKESNTEFLCIDHIGGGGNQHRQTLNGHVYEWLVKNNFPPGFRILCHNCNFSLGRYGYCPHNK